MTRVASQLMDLSFGLILRGAFSRVAKGEWQFVGPWPFAMVFSKPPQGGEGVKRCE